MANTEKRKKLKIGKKPAAVIIAGLVFFIVTLLHLLGGFSFLENKSYDWRIRFWANSDFSRPSDEIVVILLDQDSIDWAQKERSWGWPWPRQAYAEIVEYMGISGAKSVAFDVLFSEPSIYRSARQDEIIDNAIRALEEAMIDTDDHETTERQTGIERRAEGSVRQGRTRSGGFRLIRDDLLSLSAWEDDASLIYASEKYGNVVHAVMFSSQTGNILSWPEGLEKPLFQPEHFEPIIDHFSLNDNMRGQFPIEGLREAAGALGSVTGMADSDGVIRRVQPFTIFNGKAIPALSTASFLAAGYDQRIIFHPESKSLEWGYFSIPVDKNGFALLRFRADLDRYIPYRAMDIILSAEAHERGEILELGRYETAMGTEWIKYTPENFTDTHVFFGFNAPGLYDIFSSPMTSMYPGVGFHITMLDNLLQNDFIRESSTLSDLLILLLIIILIVCLSMFPNKIFIPVGGIILMVLTIVTGAFVAYQFGGLWMPMITLLAGALASFITVTIYNYATEGSQKRFIKSAFSQYLSPKVIEQLIHDPSRLKLGGEKREMTAIFTDVRAFSTFSEALGDPAKLVELLNFYLTRMSNIVLENQGTIDKYEGDAIIAFFGAPIHFDNHASLACRAAVNMKKAEKEINHDALSLGLITPGVMEAMAKKGAVASINDPCPIFTRIGMNTGDMVVGNMGTPNKMDYTIMGNAVNLAARLEGVNKQYDTSGILISEYTRAFIGDEFILRPLSRVRVVGINTPLRLYELLDIANEASQELVEMVKNWEQAFGLYEKRDFLSAQKLFQAIIDKNITLFGSTDKVVKKYLNRCIKFAATPPDEKAWDEGVDNLTEK